MHHFSSALRGGSRGGRQLQFAWVRAVAAALLAGAALFATATFAQFQFTLRKIALTNPIELCKPEFIRRIAGAPVPDSPLIPRPVHVIYYDGPVDDLLGMNLILALLSFKQLDQNTIQNELQAML